MFRFLKLLRTARPQTPVINCCQSLALVLVGCLAAGRSARADSLVFWNTLGSQSEIEHSALGPNGTFAPGGSFVAGVSGNAFSYSPGPGPSPQNLVTFPPDVIPAKAGTIELWAKLTGFPPELPWGQNPALLEINDGQKSLLFHINGNDGDSNGGVCASTQMGTMGTSRYLEVWTYDALLGGPGQGEKWHHYALVWDENGIPGVGHRQAIYVDGVLNTGSWHDFGTSFPPFAGGVLSLLPRQQRTQGMVAIDELKIWNFAKTDFTGFDPSPGSLDPLDAHITGDYFVLATAVQPDGKTILAGQFTSVLGVARNNIARLNSDGNLDPGFNPNPDDQVLSVAVQPDGKILLGGEFTTLQPNGAVAPTVRNHIARLNADGSLDQSFDPNANSVVANVAVQADGRILLGGDFTALQPNGAATPTARNHIARLNADGSLDPVFNPNANHEVWSVAVQADGKILLGGLFTALQPNGAATATTRNHVARVNADGSLDAGFDPNVLSTVNSLAVQADGKILLAGDFTWLQPNRTEGPTQRNRIARVNVDGSLDLNFNPSANDVVSTMALQADGKILLGGNFTTLQPNGATTPTTRQRIARLNADGSLDPGFDPHANGYVESVSVQADGKILLGGYFTTLQPNGAATATRRNLFARLNNDPATQTLSAPDPTQVVWQRGGASPEVSQVTFELSINGGTTWTPLGNATRLGTTADWQLTSLTLPVAGQIRARGRTAGGLFNSSGGLVEAVANVPSVLPRIAVEQPTGNHLSDGGSVDFGTVTLGDPALPKTFTLRNSGDAELNGLAITLEGVNAADFTVSALGSTKLAPGQATNFTVAFAPGATGPRSASLHLASNMPGQNPFDLTLIGSGWMDTSPGALDQLDAQIAGFEGGSLVVTTAVQPDGKMILAGYFESVLGTTRNHIARLNADGNLDSGFDPNFIGDTTVASVTVQADGKILVAGDFGALQPNGAAMTTVRSGIARLNADGSLDPGFDPRANSAVLAVAVQPDGKILIGGWFTLLQPNGAASPTRRNHIARLNADGSLDASFDPNANNEVWTVAVQADGKILLGGWFTELQPNGAATSTTRNRIARLNPDGSLDSGFDPNANNFVNSLTVQADGKILLAGGFQTLQPNGAVTSTSRNQIARVNADGSLDPGFDPNLNSSVRSLAVQADGKILIGGSFSALQPNGATSPTGRNHIARVNADGSLDLTFNPNADRQVWSVALQEDGMVLIGGEFSTLQPNGASTARVRNRFARLFNDAATQALSAPDPTQVLWQRSGASPEVSQVTFEQSTDDGTTWTALGNGTRIGTSADWQLTHLALPNRGQIRARGRTAGGLGSGSGGLAETVSSFAFNLPGIAVEQPAGTALSDGASVDFGTATVGSFGLVKTFTIRNPGTADLTGLAITRDGANADDFTVDGPGSTTVAPGSSTTFTVTFAPGAAGPRSASLHLASNAAGAQNPFDLNLTGSGWVDTSPGSVDPLNAQIVGSYVDATAVQPDGKIILAGRFTSVLGVARRNLARLNADGSLDAGFDPNANNAVYSVAMQADGRILIAGLFTTLQPNGAASATGRNRIARLNADGSLDLGFDPNANDGVLSIVVQADGKIVIGGYYTTLQPNGTAAPIPHNRIARLNADGTLDPGFDPNPDGFVRTLAVQADGKVLLGGHFGTLQPNGAANATPRYHIARVNDDGSLDPGFNPWATDFVDAMAVQADGRILLGGRFTMLQPNGAANLIPRNHVARLNADGSLDAGFDPNANGNVESVTVQADGKILLGGGFTTLQPNGAASPSPRRYIARVNADGSLDSGFDPSAYGSVSGVALQADGKILLAGVFTALQPNGAASPTSRKLFARLNNNPATQTLSPLDLTQVLWQRGGTSPEVSQVAFELSTTGGSEWTPLGDGTRVGTTADWRLTGITLPLSGQIRARGRTVGGTFNGTSGLVEAVACLPGLEISVEQPSGRSLVDGLASVDFGALTVGGFSLEKTFTISNPGAADLVGLSITADGKDAGDFTVSAPGSTTVPPGNTKTFTVTFAPGAIGPRTAVLHIASTVVCAWNPFDITLAGAGLQTPTIVASGKNFVFAFIGEPGLTYRVQYATTLTPPYTWLDFTPPAIHTAAPNGVFIDTDVNPGDSMRLYRSVLEPR